MSVHILEAMARGGFERVLALHDRRSGLRGFLGIHDTRRGPAFGGVRRWAYGDEARALSDCLRLARSMTHKCALADLPAGGGKLVLVDDPELDQRAVYEEVGRIVDSLRGAFYTGPDVGTGRRELGWIRSQTRFVTDPGSEGPGRLPESTAEGVYRAIEVALVHLDGEVDWPRRRVVVQGLGHVGARLARRLVESGAVVVGAEVDERRAERVAHALTIELIDPSAALSSPCDVFSPCALGGLLHDLTLTKLACRVVAGAANNVLAHRCHGERLFELGVLYLPDFAINSGALVRGALFHLEGRRLSVRRIGERIAATTRAILERARAENRAPVEVAEQEAERRLDPDRESRLADDPVTL
jgi:leucine dehydrogenase